MLVQQEFLTAFKAWAQLKVDWKPHLTKDNHDGPYDLMTLLYASLDKLYPELEEMKSLGYLPLMASCSRGQIGNLNAESYCERILSCANLVMTEGNTLLDSDELEMIVVLRMNKDFMEYMAHHYPDVRARLRKKRKASGEMEAEHEPIVLE